MGVRYSRRRKGKKTDATYRDAKDMKVSKLKVNLAYSTKVTIRTINGSVIASDVYIHDTKEYDNLIIKFIEVHNRVLVIYVWEGN